MKISLITVSYNSAGTIQTTLHSVAAQAYPDLEYIIVDGGSEDATLDIVRNDLSLVTCLISEKDKGIYDAMNKGLEKVSGDVIGILNSDDFYINDNVLSDVAELFELDTELEVVLGAVDLVNSKNLTRPIRSYNSGYFKLWMFRFGLMPPHPAVFVRRSAYQRVGLYKLGYKIAADFDFLIRLLLIDGAKYKTIDKIFVRMRTGGVSTSGLKSLITITREMKRSLKENGVYTNQIMLLCRLPFKFLFQVLLK